MSGISHFLSRRKQFTNEYFACPGSRKTVMISSYIWWTELIAHSLLKLGYNVLVVEPWDRFWLDDNRFVRFDNIYNQWIQTLRKFNVQLVLGGNATVMVPHPRTREPLHRAAGVPAVNYWWDEPRAAQPMMSRGFSAHDYLNVLRDSRTLNVFWDIDVCEEMRRFLAVENSIHVPLGTTPEFWQAPFIPMAERPGKLCFLGDNHEEQDWPGDVDPQTLKWAKKVVDLKLTDLDRPMVQCIETVGGPGEVRGNTARRPYELAASLKDEFERWSILGGVLLQRVRNVAVRAAAERLGDEFVLVGKGWERLGLKARSEHSGVPGAKDFYSTSQASLNLFGGCVHGGMPLRPYEIACGNGLLFTQYNRELPSLFEPGKECVAFRNVDEMRAGMDRIFSAPAEYDAIVEAGRSRASTEHTWSKRLEKILKVAKERFNLPW